VDVELLIDEVRVSAAEGMSVLDAARRAGWDVPALCHHEAVPAIASCRLCLIEVRRPGRDWVQLTTSCDYPVSDGLVVVTDSPSIHRRRAVNLELLLRRAPDAPVLRGLASQLAVTNRRFAPVTDASLPDCILCELCVRVCSSLGYNALAAIGRGTAKRIAPPFGQTAAMDCVGCGSCSEVCPTACIAMTDSATTRTIWGRTFDLLPCERCGRPITTEAHAAVMAAGDQRVKSADFCDVCKRRVTSERLAAPGR